MQKLIGRVALLTLILIAALLLHSHWKSTPAEAQPGEIESADALAVMKAGDQIHLGTITANTELGGIDIAVPNQQGEPTVYTFTDVAPDSWYVDAVNFAVSSGLMNGAADRLLFQPNFGLLRESFAMIIYRFAGGEPVETPRHLFDDVPDYEWYPDAVYWVAEKRILPGQTETHFGIGEYLTVEEALQALYRLAGRPKTDATLADYPYALKVSEEGRPAVAWAWDNGLITEIECVWYPTQTISRAQVALLLMRYSALEI